MKNSFKVNDSRNNNNNNVIDSDNNEDHRLVDSPIIVSKHSDFRLNDYENFSPAGKSNLSELN